MLGWPVGAKIGDTLLVAYHQWLTHTGHPRMNDSSSNAVVVRSTDNGQTWSDPIDIKQFGVNSGPTVLGFGNCFGVLNGKVFLATDYGLYRSENEGQTWDLIPDVLTQAETGITTSDSFGPRIIIHPDKGLVIPVAANVNAPYMDVYSSLDEGSTWERERVNLSNTFNPVEPTGIYHDGRLIFLTRNHAIPSQGPSHPAMLVSDEDGWFPMTHQGITNISSYGWPDTTDIDFNPVTERYEAVVTNRRGGVGVHEQNDANEQTVNLWSISTDDLQAGNADQWRFEATLLRLKSGWLGQTAVDIDAAHPGGAVMDVEQGVQHVFVYAGTFGTPTGIYRITRTLDTPTLSAADPPIPADPFAGIVQYTFTGGSATPANVADGVTGSNYTVATGGTSGISSSSHTAYSKRTETTTSEAGAVANGDFHEFTVIPGSEISLNLTSLEFRHNATMAAGGDWTSRLFVRSNVDSYGSNVGTTSIVNSTTDLSGGTDVTLDLSDAAYQGITDPVTFRFYLYHNATTTTNEDYHRLDNVVLNGAVVPGQSILGILALYEMNPASSTGVYPSDVEATGVAASDYTTPIGGVSGISGSSHTAYSKRTETTTSEGGALTGNDYHEFTVTPDSGLSLNLTSLEFKHNATMAAGGDWTSHVFVRTSIDSFESNVGATSAVNSITDLSGGTDVTLDLSDAAYQGITDPVTFRFYFYHDATTTTNEDFHRLDDIVLKGTVVPEFAAVVGRNIFYNGSAFGDAIATDKRALLPGETASFENYTSFDRGINGIVIDLTDATNTSAITPDDFEFSIGPGGDPDSWAPLPHDMLPGGVLGGSLEVLAGAGVDLSDRIVLRLPDGLANIWLKITVKATGNTGLAEDDVFYFANVVGETGNNDSNMLVNAADVIGVRDNGRSQANLAGIDNRFDFDRDGSVDAVDMVTARDNATSPLSELGLLDLSSPTPAPMAATPVPEPSTLVLALSALLAIAVRGRRFRS